MNILNMCCPKKPKMSLDYIINWIEAEDKNIKSIEETLSGLTTAVQVLTDWKEQIEEDDLKTLFDTYAEEYDWSQVPVIGDIQSDVSKLQQDLSSLETDVDSRLDARLEKPNVCILGNVPVWTSGNELDGTGKAIEGTAPSEDSEKLITSGAVYAGIHSYVPASISNAGWGVSVDEDGEIHIGSDYVVIDVDGGEAKINSENIDNLNRALQAPDSVPKNNSDKLITSGAVYGATLHAPKIQTEFVYDTVQSKWRLVNIGQLLEDAEFNSPILSKCEVTKSEKTFYTYACINKTLENQDGELVVRFYIDGNIFEWSDQVQGEQEAESYHFDDDLYVDKISPVY